MSTPMLDTEFKPRSATPISDFLGGRALAWLGGIATLSGIVLLLALAISHGWIGREARVAMAATGSAALLLAGVWLHARRGRTEAAVAMVGTATAGWFAAMVVAGQVYELLPAAVGVAGSMLAGGLATALAIRWAGRAIAVLGLVGALVSPVLVVPLSDGPTIATIAMLAVGAGCAMWVVLWRRWPWLAFATVLVCAPQWLAWIIQGHDPLLDVAALAVFGTIGLAGAVFAQLHSRSEDRLVRSAAALALLNAVIVGIGGKVAFGEDGSAVWLGGMALAQIGVVLWRWPRVAMHPVLRRLLIATSVIAADVALGTVFHGPAVAAAWAAVALGFAWLARRAHGGAEEPWMALALGAHIGLVLAHALIALPPSQLSDGPQLVPIMSVAILAATCLGCGRLSGSSSATWRMLVDGLGLLAVGYVTAATLSGPAQVGAWTLEAVALHQLGRRLGDPVARYGGAAFLAAAALHALVVEAPAAPIQALLTGVDNLGTIALALGAVAAAGLLVGIAEECGSRVRLALLAGSGLTLLYVASVAIITVFQPEAGTDPGLVLDLSVRQQGQVLLSAMWGVVGVGGLIAGLRRDVVALRIASLVMLLATVAKVFLYDLSALTSIYRVASFFVLGGLLLAGAFAYQRLRPPPPPDMRSVHPSQR